MTFAHTKPALPAHPFASARARRASPASLFTRARAASAVRAKLLVRACAGRVLFALLFASALLLLACGGDDAGPAPVPYDRVHCAQCIMLVGEPRFAAQLRTHDGARRYFDDPGCLLLHLAENPGVAQQSWLRHVHEERWLPLAAAGFVPAGPSPMAYGFGAVERETSGALTPEAALQRIHARHPRAPQDAP